MKTQKYYYGIFREEAGAVTVSIPDVDICETFGATWDEAYENAIDALAGCLSVPETTVRPRSEKTELEAANPGAQIVPVPVRPPSCGKLRGDETHQHQHLEKSTVRNR